MSHGPLSISSTAEPNLTPLLDVVLQLLMFFMMCVNFVTEQVNEDIKLPDSQSAKPMDKTESDVLFINLKPFRGEELAGRYKKEDLEKFAEGDPVAMALGRPPMKLTELNYFLKQQYEDAGR